ncbi:MAG: UxaA family hydrolase [Mycobacteriales bacterium]
MTVARSLLRLADEDNVLIVAASLAAGDVVEVPGDRITVVQAVELGHKVAAALITSGDKVIRFGMPIGSATQDIAAGEWVHTHNLKSDYIRTYDHRGGEQDADDSHA